MRKFIVRTVKIFAVFAAMLITGVAIAGYLAFSQPVFYAELRASDSENSKPHATLQTQLKEFQLWLRKTKEEAAYLAAMNNLSEEGEVPALSATEQSRVFTITEQQLNAHLDTKDFHAGDLRAPRFQLLENQIRFGAELYLGDSCFIISSTVTPTVTPDKKVKLTLTNTRVGNLPFPLHSALQLVSKHSKLTGRNYRMKRNGEAPVIVVDIPHHQAKDLVVRLVEFRAGVVNIEFESTAAARVAGQIQRQLFRQQ